jgi:hypothetical protein
MKTHLSIIGYLLLAVATTAVAGDPTPSQKSTRAQVKQGVLDAKAAGELHYGDEPNYPAERNTPPPKRTARKKHSAPLAPPAAVPSSALPT